MRISTKISIVLSIFIILTVVIGYFVIHQLVIISEPFQKEIPMTLDNLQKSEILNEYIQSMKYYDEVLSQSARNYAFTQDKKWEDLYHTSDTVLDKIIQDTIKKIDAKDAIVFSNVNDVNAALLKMEYESLELVNQGHPDDAIKILESKEYWDQKNAYQHKLTDHDVRYKTSYHDTFKDHIEKLNKISNNTQNLLNNNIIIISIFSASAVISLIVIRSVIVCSITKSISDLRSIIKNVGDGNFNIKTNIIGNDEIAYILEDINIMAKKLYTLYNNVHVLLVNIDKNFTIIDCNEKFIQKIGYTRDELIGTPLSKYITESVFTRVCSTPCSQEFLKKLEKDDSNSNMEISMRKKDGTVFVALINASSSIYKERIDITIIDTTDLYFNKIITVENAMWLKFHYVELQQAAKTKDEFLTMITHELKTPLVPIKAYIDLLLQDKLDTVTESQRQRLERIKNSTVVLHNMITQLLDTQQIDREQITINKKRENLTALIHDIIMEVKPTTDKHEIAIIDKIEKNVYCLCDKKRIKETLDNLILNAIDFSAKESQIQIILESKENEIEIIVKDNGVGISPENINKLFTKFYQEDTTSTRKHGGLGLGLFNCKGIIEAHGGKIWAESKGKNKGVEIHIILPR